MVATAVMAATAATAFAIDCEPDALLAWCVVPVAATGRLVRRRSV